MIEIIQDDNRISEDEEDFEIGEEDSKWSDIDSVYSTNSAIFIGGEQRSVQLQSLDWTRGFFQMNVML